VARSLLRFASLASLRGAVEIVVMVAVPVARQDLRRCRKLQLAGTRGFARRRRLLLEAHFHTRAFGELSRGIEVDCAVDDGGYRIGAKKVHKPTAFP
jgi:hypothetical protein